MVKFTFTDNDFIRFSSLQVDIQIDLWSVKSLNGDGLEHVRTIEQIRHLKRGQRGFLF